MLTSVTVVVAEKVETNFLERESIMIKQIVQAQNLATDACEALVAKARNEEGEISSWLILAAGLGVAAFAAVKTLDGTISELAGKVGKEG